MVNGFDKVWVAPWKDTLAEKDGTSSMSYDLKIRIGLRFKFGRKLCRKAWLVYELVGFGERESVVVED